MKKIVALVAALALAVPLTACGPRSDRDAGADPASQQQTPAVTNDPAAAQADLDNLDDLIGDLDGALADADAFAASADAD